ncbi:MAG: carboxypeptidase regulatory-like domain-containing protein [Candidatus Acidiferrales bacterium]
MIHSPTFRLASIPLAGSRCALLIALATGLAGFAPVPPFAQSASPQPGAAMIAGTVRDSAGLLVAGATVVLEESGRSKPVETSTDSAGAFIFSALGPGTYTLTARKSGFRAAASQPLTIVAGDRRQIPMVLESLPAAPSATSASGASPSSASSSSAAPGLMQFADQPDFKVAGISGWSNLGLHASGSNIRTSEALADDTLALKSSQPGDADMATQPAPGSPAEPGESENQLRAALAQAPQDFEANRRLASFYLRSHDYRQAVPLLEAASRVRPDDHANAFDLALAYQGEGDPSQARRQLQQVLPHADAADLHRLTGDLDERLGDPIAAVREYQAAVRLQPSEPNYFDWGAELLLHRAAQPAVEVFTQGSNAYPQSARMLAGLGAALYAAGSYQQAALRLCDAADLQPTDAAPYVFLGEMEIAAAAPLPCAAPRLARFAREQPGNALANFYYAMALEKQERGSQDLTGARRIETLLEKAVAADPSLGRAFLQLGVLYAARGDSERAIAAYRKAVAASPDLADAHYQLALACRRAGDEAQAQREFQAYQQARKDEQAAAERRRRELQQFLVVLQGPAAASPPR